MLQLPGQLAHRLHPPCWVNYVDVCRASVERVSDPALSESFFSRFYGRFIASNPRVASAFERTDMERQKSMLRESLADVFAFYVTPTDDGALARLARMHGAGGLGISADLYDEWEKAILVTLRDIDPEHSVDVERAWRIVLAPGLAFMKSFS